MKNALENTPTDIMQLPNEELAQIMDAMVEEWANYTDPESNGYCNPGLEPAYALYEGEANARLLAGDPFWKTTNA